MCWGRLGCGTVREGEGGVLGNGTVGARGGGGGGGVV